MAYPRAQGAELIVIDTPRAPTAPLAAMEFADFVLLLCRPSAFNLAAIRTTAKLM